LIVRYLAAALLAASWLNAQTAILPLAEVKAGMRGAGRTVFAGDRIEEFPVEILGVLENSAPGQSLILARLGGTEIERTGVMQGMSGSPVYVGGKLVGAIAMAFPFSKEPVTGIRPIEEMLRAGTAEAAQPRAAWSPHMDSMMPNRPAGDAIRIGERALKDIASPLGFSGFTAASIESFSAQLQQLGLDPRQGVSSGGQISPMGDKSAIQPGSMISVLLISGDMNLGADGTVTHVDGDKVLAFGHRFLSSGMVEMPFARSEVITLLPTLSTSLKISAAREWMGTMTSDYNSGIAGMLGKTASLLPVSIQVAGARTYRMQLVRDRLLSPFLLQMATFSAMDATARGSGSATISVRGRIDFTAGPPVSIDNVYSSDTGVPLVASLAGAIPLGYVFQNQFQELNPKSVELEISLVEKKQALQVENVWTSRRQARPGDVVEIFAELQGEAGSEIRRSIPWRVPIGMAPGMLQIQLSDAMTANLAEWAHAAGRPPSSAAATVDFLNRLRPNHRAYVRILKSQPAYSAGGSVLPDPPASVAMFFKTGPGVLPSGNSQSTMAEIAVDAGGFTVAGSKTASLEIVE
jgi:hypothetical protein